MSREDVHLGLKQFLKILDTQQQLKSNCGTFIQYNTIQQWKKWTTVTWNNMDESQDLNMDK